MATDYDEVRPVVAESRNASLEALKSANSPDARRVLLELDEADTVDGVELPGADLSGEELIIQVIPQAADEFTCYSCFQFPARPTAELSLPALWRMAAMRDRMLHE